MGKKLKLPKITMPKVISDAGKVIEKGVSNVAKETGKGIVQTGGAVTDVVKDVGSTAGKGIGDTVSQFGRTVGDKNIVQAGSNVSRETGGAFDKFSPLLTQIAGNALTGGAYGAISSLGGMAAGQQWNPSAIASAAGSLAGLNPTLMQALQGGASLARGDIKGAALAGLGSLGTGGGQSFLSSLTGGAGSSFTNPNSLAMLTSALTGDKKGLASGLAGLAGFQGPTSNLIGSLVGGDKKGIASSLGGSLGFGQDFSRAISGAITGDTRDLALGLVGSSGYMDPNRLKAIDALTGGKLTAENARTAFGGLLPSMGLGGGEGGDSGGDSWLKSLQNLGAGFSTGDLTPDALKGMSTSGLLPFSTSGLLPSISNPLAGMGLDLGAGGKGSENTAALKDMFGNLFGGGDGFQAGRMPAGEGVPQEGGFFDSIGDGFNNLTTGIGNFVGGNRGALGLGADALSSYLAYERGRKGFDTAKDYSKDQLSDLSGAGAGFAKVTYDPERYRQERDFIAERIAGGGITAQEKQMQQQGDLRAARAAAAARAAGVEQMARMGQGVSGAGSSLASALAGGQSVMGVQSEANLAREASASERLERDIQRGTNLSRQQTAEEADLARAQADYRLQQLQQMGATRGDLANLEMNKAAAEQRMYLEGANLAKTGLNIYESPAERDRRLAQKRLQEMPQPAPVQTAPTQAPVQQPPVERTTYTLPADIKQQVDKITQPTKPTTPSPAVPKPVTPPSTRPQPKPMPAPRPLPNPTLPKPGQVSNAINQGSYKIQSGDSLSKIYKNLGYNSYQELYQANKDLIGNDPNKIKAGATLRKKSELAKPSAASAFNTLNTKKPTGMA